MTQLQHIRCRQFFRSVLDGQTVLTPASVFDPLSARCASEIGFETMLLAGSTASLTVLGAPDLLLITLSELVEQARRITRVSTLPLLVDADHGYGNALNAARAIRELEAAGSAAITIEDTLLPEPHAQQGVGRLVGRTEAVDKLKASLAARADPATVIIARTSATQLASLSEAIERAELYQEAGADALFFSGLALADELDAISQATTLPLIVGSVPQPMKEKSYLASRRVRLALPGHAAMAAGVAALYKAMAAMRGGTPSSEIVSADDLALVKTLSEDQRHRSLVQRYLSYGRD